MVRVKMKGDDGVVLLDNKQRNHSYGTTSSFKKEEEEHPMEKIRVYSTSDDNKSKMADMRADIANFLHHNHYFHIAVTLLIFLDIMIIIAMLILEALQRDGYCIATYINTSNITEEHSKELEKYTTALEIEHILHYTSLSVLSVFMLEFVVKIFASGMAFFSHKLEVVDMVVVTVTLLLELLLSKDAVTGTVGLLLVVRLWRVVHIIANVTETISMVEGDRVVELEKLVFDLQGEVQRLKMLSV